MAREVDATGRVEADALALEQLTLDLVAARLGARADAALRVDDAVPGEGVLLRPDRVKRIAHLTRVSAEARQLRHLTVGGDTTARDAAHHRVDPLIRALARRGRLRHAAIVADLSCSGILHASPVAKITLYGSARTPFTEKVRRGLLYKQLPFELYEPTCLEDYQRWNPKSGMLPILYIDGDGDGLEERIEDSSEILFALDDRYPDPPLLSTDPTVATQQRQLAKWSDESFLWYYLKYRRMTGEGDMTPPLAGDAPREPVENDEGSSGALRRVAAWLRAGGTWERPITGLQREIGMRLDDLVNFLGARPYFYADRLSIADLCVYAMLATLRNGTIPGADRAVAIRPSLVAFMLRVEEATPQPTHSPS